MQVFLPHLSELPIYRQRLLQNLGKHGHSTQTKKLRCLWLRWRWWSMAGGGDVKHEGRILNTARRPKENETVMNFAFCRVKLKTL